MNKSNPLIVLVPFLALGVFACEQKPGTGDKPGGERPAVEVKTAAVQHVDLDRTVEVVGTLYGDEEIVVSAKVAGRVVGMSADIGDRVAGGSQLAQIDPTDYQLEVSRRENAVAEALSSLGLSELPGDDFNVDTVSTVERARFQAANARAKMERARKLFEQKPPLISEQEYADLQTAYEVSQRDFEVARLNARSQLASARSRQSELNVAREQLADTRVLAPKLDEQRRFAVATRSVSQGEYVREASPMFRLVLDDILKFRGALPERFGQDVKVGQTITIQVAGLSEPVSGKVSRTSPAVDVATRTFQIEAIFINRDGRLRPGGFARGLILVGKDENVPAVPEKAVVSFAGVDKVFSVRDGKAIEHDVDLGPRFDGMVAIRGGLNDAQTVVVGGVSKVFDGAKVQTTPSTQPTSGPTTSTTK